MSPRPWRRAAASAIGTAHVRLGLPCQDAHVCVLAETAEVAGGETVLIAVVSDGAGSAAKAEVGAGLACRLAHEEIAAALATGRVSGITRAWVVDWLARFQAEIAERAAAEECAPRDFACTLLVAVIGSDCAVFFQVGDGVIVVPAEAEEVDEAGNAGGAYRWVFWPDNGEYENVTFFAVEPQAAERLQFALVERRIDEVALLSDGLQRLALHYQSRTAHEAFFKPMLTALRTAPDDALESLSAQLETYLSSPPVNERTDDDKTLILATRA
jgi:hypothetical protein